MINSPNLTFNIFEDAIDPYSNPDLLSNIWYTTLIFLMVKIKIYNFSYNNSHDNFFSFFKI